MGKMLEAEVWTIARLEDGTAVLLRPLGADSAVPVFIGETEAQAILLGMGSDLRPDLLLELIKKDSLALWRVEVHDLREGIFYARILLTGREFSEKHPLTLDARPSEALALAVRSGGPIFIAQRVMDQAGLPVDFFLDAIGNAGANSADIMVGRSQGIEQEALQLELDQAVAGEKYERAAEIRDALALLDKGRENGQK
ncbi:hypothetical protein AGMMS49944_15130 [Spirochaetia bacterium]|nr:hypothetical protein AGMMS49944_15130 [Spirochaetia bacterium]